MTKTIEHTVENKPGIPIHYTDLEALCDLGMLRH